MSVVQRFQSQHFALEQRGMSSDGEALHRARLAVAGMAARRAESDPAAAAREVLDALGLLDARPELAAVPS